MSRPKLRPAASGAVGYFHHRAVLCLSVALLATATGSIAPAMAQSTQNQTKSFSIPAGSLTSALNSFAAQSGLQILFDASLANGKTTGGASGSLTANQALSSILAGSGITYRYTGQSTITLDGPDAANSGATIDGAIALDTIDVSGGGGPGYDRDLPYQTPASTSYISGETIARYPVSSPSDIFRGTPGVLSGESRNGNSVDVNIRGMQGMGRVPVTVDGAMNANTVYQGYQGIGNRSYIDTDFIAGVTIDKGPSSAPGGGIGGSVRMSTIGADDILRDGQSIGLRIKAGVGTNTSTVPDYATRGGFNFPRGNRAPGIDGDADGMDRPGLFEPTNGNGSVAFAAKGENAEIFAAYALRKRGNYHAGKHGQLPGTSGNVGPHTECIALGMFCTTYPEWYVNTGLSAYRAGEEVLNTSVDTRSSLVKTKFRFGDGHSIQFGYTGFNSEHGELRAMELSGLEQRPQQKWLSTAEVHSFTSRYRWTPANNDLIDLKWNSWTSWQRMLQPTTAGSYYTDQLGLPRPTIARTLVGSDARMMGTDISNTSRFDTTLGGLAIDYGGSYLNEDTHPKDYVSIFLQRAAGRVARDGMREEINLFSKATWDPTNWLKIDAGLKYYYFRSEDRLTDADSYVGSYGDQQKERNGDGVAPSASVTLMPFDGVQVYASYTEGIRMPSLMESSNAFNMYIAPGLKAEHARNWEVGFNLMQDSALRRDDSVRLKLSYFDNTIEDYLSRTMITVLGAPLLSIYNIDQAHFAGVEFSGRYELGGFSADFGATYYTDVEFCRTSDTCVSSSLAMDYATNHIPPEYTLSLGLSQKLLTDKLTLSGRATYVGPRSAGYEPPPSGAAELIAPVLWKPYTLIDIAASYEFAEDKVLEIAVDNLTDRYYVDPLGLAAVPAPGRTIRAGLTAKF